MKRFWLLMILCLLFLGRTEAQNKDKDKHRPAALDAVVLCSPSVSVSNCPDGQAVTTIGAANVRQAPVNGAAGALLGTQPASAAGTVTGVPIPSSSTYQWFNVKFTTGVSGYVGGDNLTPAATPPPVVNALAGFSCTPSFAPVTLNSFIPSGATGLMFVINNPGVNALVITGANVPVPFVLQGTTGTGLPATVAPGASLPMIVKFVPTVAGTFTGNIVFSANVLGGSFSMGVAGVAK